MKRVRKSINEPSELTAFRVRLARQPSPPLWSQFKSDPTRTRPVKEQLRADQSGLCAYCEVKLSEGNETVEHFVPRAKDHGRELDWQNLLLVCGGDEKSPPPKEFSCGHARNYAGSPVVLNPLNIPAGERLFTLESRTGKLNPDAPSCGRCGVSEQLVQATIRDLGLSVSRLSRARLRILETIDQQIAALVSAGSTFDEAERQLASEQFLPNATWPEFFTTLRWRLGDAAENRLTEIGYNG